MREPVIQLLTERPVLLLVVIVGVGTLLGRIRVAGVALGPAAALFCGLAVSAWDGRLALDEQFAAFGLVLFAYTIGVAAGPQLRAIASRHGAKVAACVTASLAVGAVAAHTMGTVVGLDSGGIGGLFAGALTNTPALAAVAARHPDGAATVAYSLAYPVGVIGPLLATQFVLRRRHRTTAPQPETVVSLTVEVTRPLDPVAELRSFDGADLAFSRFEHDGHVQVPAPDTVLGEGDLVTVVGAPDDVARFADHAGQLADRHLPDDRADVDFRRIIVSRRAHTGRRLGELGLHDQFGVTVTRVRRGDVDFVARDDLMLQAGDRLRVVGPRTQLAQVAKHLGDSVHGVADIDFAAFGLAIAAGILVGRIPFPVPGGTLLRLGDAGGCLLVGLAVGARTRLGRLHFALPVEENLVLRNLGTMMLLATIGSRSGAAFASAVTSWQGLTTVAAGVAVTGIGTAVAVWLLGRVAEPAQASGMLAGVHTQPAVLATAQAKAGDPTPVGVGYATAYPVAMVVKLLAAQLLAR